MLTRPQKKVGTVAKDNSSGPFAEEWKAALGDISKDVEEVDISTALSAAFAVKDENELVSSCGHDAGLRLISRSDLCVTLPAHVLDS